MSETNLRSKTSTNFQQKKEKKRCLAGGRVAGARHVGTARQHQRLLVARELRDGNHRGEEGRPRLRLGVDAHLEEGFGWV